MPACREVLFDGQGGILVPQGNLEIWQEKLSYLMDSKDKRYLLANKARVLSKYYDIKLVSKEFINLLNAI